ncbi:hypothetical protein Tco_1480228 [Tanacetum coccineum]
MTTLADKSLLSGGDNKPPMVGKHLYDSWKSRMELYMMNRPNGRMILASVENGPLVWLTITVDGATRPNSPQYGSPFQSQQYSTLSTPLSITYPSNEYQLLIHHNVYSLSSSIPQLEYTPSVNQQSEFSQPDSGLIVPVFQKGDDLIDAINHMMSFLTAVVTSGYPTTNNQLRNSSNPRQLATINNGRVTI